MLKIIGEKIAEGAMEYVVSFILIVYGSIFVWGMRRNQRISQDWLDQVRSVVFDNFTVIGTGMNEVEVKDANQITFE